MVCRHFIPHEVDMARPLRIEYPGAFYHVTSRGIERRSIFHSNADRKRFLSYLASAHERHGVLIHAYCLMDNHYHLLIETPVGNLSKILHHINGAYTTFFNIRHNRVGPLFQGRYKAILVERDAYAQELSRYIHLNPVRAGVVARPDDYPWSSYRYFTVKQPLPEWLSVDFILGYFGTSKKQVHATYRRFVEEIIGVSSDNPMEQVVASAFLGSDEFIQSVQEQYLDKTTMDMRNIPTLRQIARKPTLEEVKDAVTSVVGETIGPSRGICLYVSQFHAGAMLNEIGDYYGMNGSAVSQANRRFKYKLQKDETLQKIVKEVANKLKSLIVET